MFAQAVRWTLAWILAGAFLTTVHARFADTTGFSGKQGVDCGSCHAPPPVDPTDAAEAWLEGLPAAWEPDRTYDLHIRVTGGPSMNPVPGQPLGGFDLETDAGTLAAPANMSGLLRTAGPHEITYTGEGTLRRAWSVQWTAPNLTCPPEEARFWLAVLSANGNHLMDGPDTAGERGDRHAKLFRAVPASAAAQQAWEARPLDPPVLDALPPLILPPIVVTGNVTDFADGAEWSLDGGVWKVAAGRPRFIFEITVLAPGPHDLAVRTLWHDRHSEPTLVRLDVPGDEREASAASAPGLGWLASAAVAFGAFLLDRRSGGRT